MACLRSGDRESPSPHEDPSPWKYPQRQKEEMLRLLQRLFPNTIAQERQDFEREVARCVPLSDAELGQEAARCRELSATEPLGRVADPNLPRPHLRSQAAMMLLMSRTPLPHEHR